MAQPETHEMTSMGGTAQQPPPGPEEPPPGPELPVLRPDTDSSSTNSDLPETDLRRVLKERHVNMIAFSTCVGVGLFLQSGRVIYLAGPGLAIFAYLFSASIMWCTMGSLGEMTALFPIQGSLFVFPRRFVDEGVGYACGWLTWFSWVVIIASEVLAVSQLFKFRFSEDYLKDVGYPDKQLGWQVGQDANPAIWVTIFLVVIFFVNCLPVLYYGRLEYIFGCIKMIFLVGLILFNLTIHAKQRVPHDSRFWTYDDPYSFASKNITLRVDPSGKEKVLSGSPGIFLGMWSALTTVLFSMIGFEAVSITAAENFDLTRTETVKMATRKISLRIIILYTLATFAVGLNVPYTDPNLRDLTINSIRSGQHSIFILAAVRNRMRWWPEFFNGFFIFTATTSGINSLYLSSRILHALASVREVWPEDYHIARSIRARLERTKWGVPYGAVCTSWLFGTLAYLATKPVPSVELGRMATNAVVSMLIVYIAICASYLQFYKHIRIAAEDNQNQNARSYNRNSSRYPYKSWGQYLKAWIGLVGCSLLAFFNGWHAFVQPFRVSDFLASYMSFFIFIAIVMLYHARLDDSWNPRNWTRRTTFQLKHPMPVVVQNRRRRGKLAFKNEMGWKFWTVNGVALAVWIWHWLK